jgi:hypothetical protein
MMAPTGGLKAAANMIYLLSLFAAKLSFHQIVIKTDKRPRRSVSGAEDNLSLCPNNDD